MMKLKSALIPYTLLFFIFFINGCCWEDGTCPDDEVFCNGDEICIRQTWICSHENPPCPSGICFEDTTSCGCWTFEDCDDGDLCTLDQCLTNNTCLWLDAIECPEGEKCNPSTGECE